MKQSSAQYEHEGYGAGDRAKKAKPAGYRYLRIVDKKTGKIRSITKDDKEYYLTPTRKLITAYEAGDKIARKMLYFENRKDHSDKSLSPRSFAKGGGVDEKSNSEGVNFKVENNNDLEEVAKSMFNAVKKHRWDLKDLIFYFEKDNNFDYKVRVKVWNDMNVYEMPKTYDNILKLLKAIVEGNNKKFAKGGSLWTDLDFESIEEYFDYIADSLTNGNRQQVRDLYNDMDESQKKQFFRYASDNDYFDEVVSYINNEVREYAKGGGVGDEDEFIVHGHYTVSNSGGYEIMLDDSGESARVRDAFGSENPETSDWLEIEMVENEEGEPDEDGYLPLEPVIDPQGYNIPLNMVVRVHKKGGDIKADKRLKALHAGKRESAEGNTYYEYRQNRSDVNRTKRFENGGGMSSHHSDKLHHTSLSKYAKGGEVSIGEHKAQYQVKYKLSDDEKLQIGYIVAVKALNGNTIDHYLLYNKKKELVKELHLAEAHKMVGDGKLVMVKTYDIKIESAPKEDNVPFKDMDYSQKREWIKNNIIPNLKSAKLFWRDYQGGGSYDLNDKKEDAKFLEDARESADYGTLEEFEEKTGLKVDESGWGIESKDGDEFEQVAQDNTYNWSYLGIFDWNFRVYSIFDERFVLIAHPHMGGDARGNYGDPIFFEGDSEEDVLYKFRENVIDGGRGVVFTFKDKSELSFDSTQDSDVSYYELYEDHSRKKKLGKSAQLLVDTFDSLKGSDKDELLENTVDEFINSKTKKKELGGELSSEMANESISHGTLKTEDLVDSFLSFLQSVKHELKIEDKVDLLQDEADSLERDENNEFVDQEVAEMFLNEDLFSMMTEIAPEGTVFCSHIGDGSDFGFWNFEGEEYAKGGKLGHKRVSVTKGYRLEGGYDTVKGSDKTRNYSKGVKRLKLDTGFRLKHGNEVVEGAYNKKYENGGGVDKTPKDIEERLEYLRGELRAEQISQGELIELQSLAKYIDSGDVELLEASGVPEFDDENDEYAKGGEFGKIPKNSKYNDVVDIYNRLILPKYVFLKGKKYVGEASIINGYNGYNSTPTDGLFGVFKPVGIGQNVWNGFIGYLQDDKGFYLRAKERREQTIDIKEANDEYAKGGSVKKRLVKQKVVRQKSGQYEAEREEYGNRDNAVQARPVGYRYRKVRAESGRLRPVKKSDKEYYGSVSQKDIKLYEAGDKSARRMIYFENRKDHSDRNPSTKRGV